MTLELALEQADPALTVEKALQQWEQSLAGPSSELESSADSAKVRQRADQE